jgi:integrase
MTKSTGKLPHTLKSVIYHDCAVKPIGSWAPANRGLYARFQAWLCDGGYSEATRNLYGVPARLTLGLLDQPYWTINPDTDLDSAREYIDSHFDSTSTRDSYLKGLAKFEAFLRERLHRPPPERTIHWQHYLGTMPEWLSEAVKEYLTLRRRAWPPELQYRASLSLLTQLTRSLRWIAWHTTLTAWTDLTPGLWFQYVDARLARGIRPVTLNGELHQVQSWLRFVQEQGDPVCARLLQVEPFRVGPRLPRDVPLEPLRRLLQEIRTEAGSTHAGVRRMARMDHAWFLLMLHCGLRTGEVRRLRLSDVDWDSRRMRIEQSKGLKDRLVYLSAEAVAALQTYLSVRGAGEIGSNHLFLYRHAPLSPSYCARRLETYGARCGVRVTPHQLRHSCATLLLNAGAPVLTVQAILGHQHVDTTLGYARLYDGTVAADYYRAMREVERRFGGPEDPARPPLSSGHLLALVDSLSGGTLNERQRGLVQALRDGIRALTGTRSVSGRSR